MCQSVHVHVHNYYALLVGGTDVREEYEVCEVCEVCRSLSGAGSQWTQWVVCVYMYMYVHVHVQCFDRSMGG